MDRLYKAAFWGASLFAFVMAVLPHPPMVPGEPSDKIQHIIAFATLTVLGTLAYPRTRALKLLAGLCLFGAAIELAQTVPELHRDADVRDWLADTAAVLAILAVILAGRRLRPARA